MLINVSDNRRHLEAIEKAFVNARGLWCSLVVGSWDPTPEDNLWLVPYFTGPLPLWFPLDFHFFFAFLFLFSAWNYAKLSVNTALWHAKRLFIWISLPSALQRSQLSLDLYFSTFLYLLNCISSFYVSFCYPSCFPLTRSSCCDNLHASLCKNCTFHPAIELYIE